MRRERKESDVDREIARGEIETAVVACAAALVCAIALQLLKGGI